MGKGRKQLLTAFGLVAAIGMASAPRAEATLILAGMFDGVAFCATDNNVACGFGIQIPDVSAVVGRLELADQTIGGLQVNGSLQTQTIALLAGQNNVLNTGSLSVINGTGAAVAGSLAIGATSYIGPSTQAFASGSGTWQSAGGSTINMTWYNDPTNTQGATAPNVRPGTQIASFFDLASNPVDSFSSGTLGPFAVNDGALFGMTLGVDFNLIAGGQLINRGQTEIKPRNVPEPLTMTLLGLGFCGVGAAFRRRRGR